MGVNVERWTTEDGRLEGGVRWHWLTGTYLKACGNRAWVSRSTKPRESETVAPLPRIRDKYLCKHFSLEPPFIQL